MSPRLVLAPASARGWFGGRALVADECLEVRTGVPLAQAAQELERAFLAETPALTVVLAPYAGDCTVVHFAPPSERVAARPLTPPTPAAAGTALLRGASFDLAPRAYRSAVRDVRARIAAGDVYVLNLTARLEGELACASPEDAFDALVARAGGDLSALLTGLPGATPWIASVSPERFVRVVRGSLGERLSEIAPIKGTAPRGLDPVTDAALAAALAADEKERAEHVMVVDLERNDLGVVCEPGSVHVDPLFEVVPTPYCHQLVSTVRGTLRAEATFAELLAAVFPCGSVTGAPKRAAMHEIAELEVTGRGAYCGALLVAMPGELDSSVLIRTLEGVEGDPALARWGTGCGVTSDSRETAEELELLLKASPVLGDGAPEEALRESMRTSHGRAALLERHLARLARGGCGPTVLARVREAVARELARPEAAGEYARLGVTVTPDGAVAAGLTLDRSSLDVAGWPVLVPVEIAEPRHLPPSAAKPAARRFWDRAHHTATLAGAHQAVVHTPDGTLVDGTTATLWLVRDGELLTPPSPPAIAGIARELVFDLAEEAGIPAREAALTLDDLEAADEVALSNAVGGFVAVRDRGGAITAHLAEAVARAMRVDA